MLTNWKTDHCAGYVDQREYFWADNPIVDIPSVPFVLDQPRLPKYGKLLRDIRLSIAQVVFEMTDAFLTAS